METSNSSHNSVYPEADSSSANASEDVKYLRVETQDEIMERLNLVLEKQVFYLEQVLSKKQSHIQNLKVALDNERKSKELAVSKHTKLREYVVGLHSQVGSLITELKSQQAKDHTPTGEVEDENNKYAAEAIKLLQLQLHRKFNESLKSNYTIREEIAHMKGLLERLERYCKKSNSELQTSNDPEVITLDNSDLETEETTELYEFIDNEHQEQPIDEVEEEEEDEEIETEFICGICSKKLPTSYVLNRHIETYHKSITKDKSKRKTQVRCRKCGKIFGTRKALFAHHKSVHSSNTRISAVTPNTSEAPPVHVPTQVNSAGATHKLGSDGRYHGKDTSKAHLGFFCICGATYSYYSSLHEHVHGLVDEWKFLCTVCGAKFYRAPYLRKHMMQAHNIMSYPSFGCRLCGKQFQAMLQLIRHRRVHHRRGYNINRNVENAQGFQPQDSFREPQAQPQFPIQTIHQQGSSITPVYHDYALPVPNSNRFYCTCTMSFSTRKMLTYHIKAKVNGKIFKCKLCANAFEFHASLKHHMERKHGMRYQGGKFGCRDCGQTFHMYHELMNHRIRNHYDYNSI